MSSRSRSAPLEEDARGGAAGQREPSHGPARRQPAAEAESGEQPAPGLHVVATPIGHLGDISLRALRVLAGVDAVACEDTRVTGKLLAAHGIRTPLVSYHEHNAGRRRPELLARLHAGAAIALVTDAGTPLVSDPGYKLVRAVLDEGLPVTAVPGPSAALAALVVSGLPSDRFFFQGFLPAKTGPRRTELAELTGLRASLVIYESPRRLAASLTDMVDVLGPREAAVTRELTKRFEEVRRGTLGELAEHYRDAGPPKGEVVVVVGPPRAREADDAETLDARLEQALDQTSLRDAVAEVAAATGLPRKRVYDRALALKGKGRR